jgi:hypothetical protein
MLKRSATGLAGSAADFGHTATTVAAIGWQIKLALVDLGEAMRTDGVSNLSKYGRTVCPFKAQLRSPVAAIVANVSGQLAFD